MLKAANVNIALNKEKILLILYSSKTHDESTYSQEIKIESNKQANRSTAQNFCPFELTTTYYKIRGDYYTPDDQFFIFKDKSPVTPEKARKVLREMITKLSLDASLYDMQSLRIGRATDMVKFGYTVEQVQRAGRWKSSAVYRYIRQ